MARIITWWLLAGLLVGGCRGARVAVPLPPESTVAIPSRRPITPPAEAQAAFEASEARPTLPLHAPAPMAPVVVSASHPAPDKPAASSLPSPVRSQVANPTPQPAGQASAPKPTGWGSILQVIGTGLVLGGLVLGLVVGGWGGFGIFLLGALAGGFAAFCGSFLIDGQLP